MPDRTIPFYNMILRCDRVLPMEVTLPKGYAIRTWQSGDEAAWAALECAVGDFSEESTAKQYFVDKYLADPAVAAERVFFLTDPAGEIVGSVICWEDMRQGMPVLSLHWLVVVEGEQGKGLGKALCSHALRIFRRIDNARPVYIHTQPWSWKAILLYVKLGFKLQPEDTFADYENQYPQAMEALKNVLTQEQYDYLCRNTAPAVARGSLDAIRYDEKGLVPAIAQDAVTGEVLMLAYMNAESLRLTIESGYATYFSRSRQELWRKGATSGHLQRVVTLSYDCDGDAILMQVMQTGPACHTGQKSCFHNPVVQGEMPPSAAILQTVYDTVADRAVHPKEGSYTNYLLNKGAEKIAKKVGEEASETIIAAVKRNPAEVAGEAADLLYHLMVLLYDQGVTPQDVWHELQKRH